MSKLGETKIKRVFALILVFMICLLLASCTVNDVLSKDILNKSISNETYGEGNPKEIFGLNKMSGFNNFKFTVNDFKKGAVSYFSSPKAEMFLSTLSLPQQNHRSSDRWF